MKNYRVLSILGWRVLGLAFVLFLAGVPPIAAEDLDLHGHDREWWQHQIQQWETKKSDAQEKLADAQERLGRETFLNTTAGSFQRRQEIDQEIVVYQKQIDEANRMLNEELPDDARKAGAPPGWLRD